MIELPAWTAGRTISPRPACGPELSSRRSLQIFDSFIAVRFMTDDVDMNTPVSLVASMRSSAMTSSSNPVISRRWPMTASP